MLVALIGKDRPGALQTRLENRAAHVEHIRSSGKVFMAGPLMENGEMRGSLVILDVPDMEAAKAWAAADPYALAGLFETVTLTEWNKVIG